MVLVVVLLPLVSSIISGLFGFLFGSYGSVLIVLGFLGLSLLLALRLMVSVCFGGSPEHVDLFNWCDSFNLNVGIGFIVDSLSIVMSVIVILISFLVHLYSLDYMSHDPRLVKFLSLLSFFTFFMLVLVVSDNLVQLFIGWEGVGLSSYFLISFWNTRIQANKSAMKAIIMNRVGDYFLSIGIFFMFYTGYCVQFFNISSILDLEYIVNMRSHLPTIRGWTFWLKLFREIFFDVLNHEGNPNYHNPFFPREIFSREYVNLISIVMLLLFLGAVGKSAQIGLHTWLPDAMEGPTPVSALIHAATMVTAGVFLILRCSDLFSCATTNVSIFIMSIGSLTAFFAATIGLFQNDVKKIIAYSTCSQLGYMVFSCSLSDYVLSFYHVVNHAFFKAMLFLCAGCIIHALGNEQDIRRTGGLKDIMPFTYACMLVASLSLAGFPFLSGFYSKESIVELSFYKIRSELHIMFYFLVLVTVLMTSIYSFKLIYKVFFLSNYNNKALNKYTKDFFYKKPKDSNRLLSSIFLVLTVGSVFSGYLLKDLFLGIGSPAWLESVGVSKAFYVNDEDYFTRRLTRELVQRYSRLEGGGLIVERIRDLQHYADCKLSDYQNSTIQDNEWFMYGLDIQGDMDKTFFKVLPLLLCILGILFIIIFYSSKNYSSNYNKTNRFVALKKRNIIHSYIILFYSILFNHFKMIFYKKWHIDSVYFKVFAKRMLSFSYRIPYKTIDRGVLEYIGPRFFIKAPYFISNLVHKVESRNVYNDMLFIVISICIVCTTYYFI